MSIALRLNDFLTKKEIKIYLLEEELELGARSLQKAFKENRSIGSETIGKIVTKFPDLDPVWLLTGEKKAPQVQGDKYLQLVEEREKEREYFSETISYLKENDRVQNAKLWALEEFVSRLAAGMISQKPALDQLEALGMLEASDLAKTSNKRNPEDAGKIDKLIESVLVEG